MRILRVFLFVVSLGILGVCVAVRYDILPIPIITQIVSYQEFEFALVSYLLLLLTVAVRRAN